MDIKLAQQIFTDLIQKTEEQNLNGEFFPWIEENFLKKNKRDANKICNGGATQMSPVIDDATIERKLQAISKDIRTSVPLDAVLSTEKIKYPDYGEYSEIDPSHVLHVDAFLYDDLLLDELVDDGKISRNFCNDCGSHNTQPLVYVSHSMSMEQLYYVFKILLPPLPEDAVLIDVGSRLGAVLYGAYFHTRCRNLFGVEMDPSWCEVQKNMVKKHKLEDRLNIIHGDIQHQPDLLKKADVIVLNNVFEFFACSNLQVEIWQFLKSMLKKGCQIVSLPPLEQTLEQINIDFDLNKWVQEMPRHNLHIANPDRFEDEISQLKRYRVL